MKDSMRNLIYKLIILVPIGLIAAALAINTGNMAWMLYYAMLCIYSLMIEYM